MGFHDRTDAGRQLARRLRAYRGPNVVVLALPRGGVPVAVEVARALAAPLDVLVVRKIGAPHAPELGLGAVAEGGVTYLDPQMVFAVGATQEHIEQTIAREREEVSRRVSRWRGRGERVPLAGKTVVVVDDGIATGGTVRAALRALRAHEPAKIVLAVPVAPIETLASLAQDADDVVCLEPVEQLWSVGEWYGDFRQVSDDTVTALLAGATVDALRGSDDVAGSR